MPDAAPSPRLVVTDALGRRIVNIDKPLFTIGRRSETDLRLPGADISRVHAEISVENGACTIRDKQSRFGTFVNGEKHNEKVLAHGDQIRLGQAGDTEIVSIDDEAPSVERARSGRQRAAPDGGLLENACARLGPGARRCWRWCSTRRSR
jgi:pSer/pThr/pTyr-binding forkhead associated (FHA) protein